MQNTCWFNLNLQLLLPFLLGCPNLPGGGDDPAGKSWDKTQTGHVPHVLTAPGSPREAPFGSATQFLSAPPPICPQISPVGEIKGWGCCPSSLPRDTNSASLLFPQGRGRPAGSKSAASFQNRRTRPCHRCLSPMIIYRLIPAMSASSSFPKEHNSLQKTSTGLRVELVTGCWGGQGYKRI